MVLNPKAIELFQHTQFKHVLDEFLQLAATTPHLLPSLVQFPLLTLQNLHDLLVCLLMDCKLIS